jgi:hypothetical protein
VYKIVEVERGQPLPGKAGKVEEWDYRGDLKSYYEDSCTEDGEWWGLEKEFQDTYNYLTQGYRADPDGEIRIPQFKAVVLVAEVEPEVNEFGVVCP